MSYTVSTQKENFYYDHFSSDLLFILIPKKYLTFSTVFCMLIYQRIKKMNDKNISFIQHVILLLSKKY